MDLSKEKLSPAPHERSYGADLLRIVSMCMILTSHFFVHGGILGKLSVHNPNFYVSWFIEACCYVMVNCFVLITGYFQSATTFKLKKLLLLWGQIIAISGGAYLILCAVGKVDFSLDGFIPAATPVTSQRYWFATAYVMLYMLSPVLNLLVNKLNRREHFTVCAVLFGTLVVLRNFVYWNDFANLHGGYSYTSFVVLYVIGAYMRKYGVKLPHPLAGYFGLSAVTALSRIVMTLLWQNFQFDSKYIKVFMQYNSITVVLASICLFDYFVHLEIKNKAAVSLIKYYAPLTFGVYLIHEQIEVKGIIWKWLAPSRFVSSPKLYLYLIFVVALLFLGCSMCDFLRHTLSRLLKIPEIFGKISGFLEKQAKAVMGWVYK